MNLWESGIINVEDGCSFDKKFKLGLCEKPGYLANAIEMMNSH